ncbi:TPA: ORF6N domain-containing protein [Escherichia coli]|uniref:ORF6N domain-containing protein n=2 Tax=Escherichia coli TaxID=562 RepID=UPI00169101BA|nr:ORF6N domain-containing protein [Escherichia coli]EEZ6063660.1 ORF6N domain-containing protein [Escherichia coli]EFB1546922.1 ORF6N domain-containing protein [Escherichia coli]EFK0448214.1 ORF6N domain-containing protein [Escherichia coli]EFM0075750.1 ORF6N domain-containing protein [Escherichia coli]EHH8738640.1 ORF6N domain-containing protein [Escherichia coli]
MTTQISVETLSPLTHNQIPVITTELLAQLYCTGINNIKVNYTRNSERFVEGKHFFKVVGDELKNLRVTLSNSQNLQPSLRGLQISPKTRSLILWTERGAARHAKMLETDQAWEVFEKLEDCYFSQKQPPAAQTPPTQNDGCALLIHFDKHGQVEFTEKVPADAMVCTLERFKFYLEQHGWIVARKEQLVERLMRL